LTYCEALIKLKANEQKSQGVIFMDYEEKIKQAEEKLKKAEAAVKRIKALNDKKTRTEETRIKILTGAALLNFMSKTSDEQAKIYISKILKQNLNDRDFEYLNSKIEGLKI
jgi:multidrug resistance efflux pump